MLSMNPLIDHILQFGNLNKTKSTSLRARQQGSNFVLRFCYCNNKGEEITYYFLDKAVDIYRYFFSTFVYIDSFYLR